MNKMYTIKEIADLLGLSKDAIYFYEKKGFVHPYVHPNNKYRYYSLVNVLELLDIIYYRHLDFSIGEIQALYQDMNPQVMIETLKAKEKQAFYRIRYEEQLLKKLSYIRTVYEEVEQKANCCNIKYLPNMLALFESENKEHFFIHDIKYMTQDQFVLCSLYQYYVCQANTWQSMHTIVGLEMEIIEHLNMELELNKDHMFGGQLCISCVVPFQDKKLPQNAIEHMLAYAKSLHHKTLPACFVRELPLTFYKDERHYYAEIFLPIQ